jgi:MYXO-CTERM domain-containing protein
VPHFAEGLPVAIAADGVTTAWVFYSSGDVWRLTKLGGVGDDDDSTGDDDDSAGDDDDDSAGDDDDDSAGDDDDDDSAGDDDDADSAGDDDDSAGDDDDSAGGVLPPDSGFDWQYEFFSSEAPASALDVIHQAAGEDAYIYTASSSAVRVRTASGELLSTFALGGVAGGLSASSFADGALYASVPELDQVELISAAPFITLDSAEPTYLPEATDTMVVTFTVWMGAEETDVCEYSMAIDGDITGGGTPLEGVTGQAGHGTPNVETLTGEDLPAGTHRLWIYCEDDEGDIGRISFPFEYSGLAAPADLTLDPDYQEIVVSWTHDGTSPAYVLYFSDTAFTASEAPSFCNGDASLCSPHVVTVASAGDDDDDSSGDDDDSAQDPGAAGETLSVTVDKLTNGTRYYFALAAFDSTGTEGPRTDVLYATPSVLGGAAALAGDSGGCSCNSSSQPGATLPALLLLGLFLRLGRRTRGSYR